MRLLIVQTQPLGDVVLSTGFFREAARLAGQPVDLVVRAIAEELVRAQPWAGHVETIPGGNSPVGIPEMVRVRRRLATRRYDAILTAQRSHRTGFLVRALRSRRRIGYDDAPGRWAYTQTVPRHMDQHAARRPLALLGALGADPASLTADPTLTIPDAVRQRNEALRLELPPSPWIALAPGSARPTKRWPPERYARLAAELSVQGLRSVVFGGADERPAGEVIAAAASDAVDLTGESSPLEMADLLRDATLTVSNDSAAGHIAAAVGTRVITLFGPTAPSQGFAPWGAGHVALGVEGLDCRPCHRTGPDRCPLGHHRCMADLSLATVLTAAQRLAAEVGEAR